MQLGSDLYVTNDLTIQSLTSLNGGTIHVAGQFIENDQTWYGTGAIQSWVMNQAPTDLVLSANTVAENAANGTVVGTVSGTDPDAGDTKTYSLTDSAGGRFAIDATTGQITVANSALLDYESTTSHSVTVRITDSGGLTYAEMFTITVTNVNEAPTGADITITIDEDTSHTMTVANFGFSDADAGESLSAVRLDSVPSAGTLTLSGVAVMAGHVVSVADITAGNLVFIPSAHANGIGYASFTFSVRDSNAAYASTSNTVTVHVTSVDDAPINTVPGAQTVAVDTPLMISGVSVHDVDGNLTTVQLAVTNGTVHVTLSGTATISAGANSTATLTLTGTQADINGTLRSLSYQGTALFTGTDTLSIIATDGDGATDTDTVAITVSNSAHSNVLPGPQTIAEDTALAISGVSVTDTDGNVTSVQLSTTHGTVVVAVQGATTISAGSNGSGSVTLSGTQADLNATLASLTYQGNPNFTGLDSLTIMSTDSLGVVDTDSVSITVTPVNDTPTDLVLSADTVAENAANGTVVGTVGGVDPDSGETKAYSLLDSAGGRFAIDAGTGQITVADGSLLNYELATSHSVTIRVTDVGGLTYDETVTINVNNVNEQPTGIERGAGGEQAFIASLFQKNPSASEIVLPLASSPRIESDSGRSEWRLVADDSRNSLEWNALPAPTADILSPAQNLFNLVHFDLAYKGDENPVDDAERKDNVSTASSQQDETVVSLDSTNAVPPESRTVVWLPTEETETVPERSWEIAVLIGAGFVGAALQKSRSRKGKMTFPHGESPTDDQGAADEQTSREPCADKKETPPNAA